MTNKILLSIIASALLALVYFIGNTYYTAIDIAIVGVDFVDSVAAIRDSPEE